MERQFLNLEELRETIPSVYQEYPHPDVTNRYTFVPTYQILSNFDKLGWKPVQVKQIKSRNNAKFAQHMIRLNNINCPAEFRNVGDIAPEIVISNSHDRSSCLFIEMGIYRKMCSNGLIVADSSFSKINIRHMDINFEYIQELTYNILENFTKIYNKIADYKSIILSKEEKIEFADKVIKMVWKDNKFVPEQLLEVRRPEDKSDDLFTTYNVIQENVMKGGLIYRTSKGFRKSREIKSIWGDLYINRFLWMTMEAIRISRRAYY